MHLAMPPPKEPKARASVLKRQKGKASVDGSEVFILPSAEQVAGTDGIAGGESSQGGQRKRAPVACVM